MPDAPKTMGLPEWALLIFLSVLWGSAFFFAGITVKEIPPFIVVFARIFLAALFLLPFFWFYGHKLPITVKEWMPFFIMGVLNNAVPFSFQFVSQTIITVGLISIINAMTPLFTLIIVASFGEEKMTRNRIFGVLIGFLGVVILRGIEEPVDSLQTLGIGLGLAGALSFGFAALWGRRYLQGVAPLKSATCQLICSSAIMLIVVGIFENPSSLNAPSLKAWLALMGLTVFGTACSYLVFFRLLAQAGATNVQLVTLLIPITALFLGNMFLHETIQLKEIVGAVIIGIGLLFIDGRVPNAIVRRLSV